MKDQAISASLNSCYVSVPLAALWAGAEAWEGGMEGGRAASPVSFFSSLLIRLHLSSCCLDFPDPGTIFRHPLFEEAASMPS